MATTKVTFTLDDETIAQIRRLANRAHRPQSAIVREAVAHYAPPGKTSSRLTSGTTCFGCSTEMVARAPQPGDKTAADVDRELRQLRLARRTRGRLHPVD